MPLGTKVGLRPGDSELDGDPAPPTKGVETPHQFSVHVYCGQTAGCIKMPLGMEVGLRLGDFVLDGNPAPLPKKEAEPPPGGSPIFGPCLLWPNGWMDQDSAWHGGRPWSSPHCARWGHSSPPQKGGRTPHFSAHLYCGQAAGCIKMPLGMNVGLSPGDFVVVDGDPDPYPKRSGAPPNFRQTSIVVKRLHGSRYHVVRWSVGLDLRDSVFDVDPATLREKSRPTLTQFLAQVYCGQMAG